MDLKELKKLGDFYSFNIFAPEAAEARETHEGGTRPERDLVAWDPPWATPPRPVPCPSVASHPSFMYDSVQDENPTPYFT
jgi:hypothetical protein